MALRCHLHRLHPEAFQEECGLAESAKAFHPICLEVAHHPAADSESEESAKAFHPICPAVAHLQVEDNELAELATANHRIPAEVDRQAQSAASARDLEAQKLPEDNR